jgi:hypothetical protein
MIEVQDLLWYNKRVGSNKKGTLYHYGMSAQNTFDPRVPGRCLFEKKDLSEISVFVFSKIRALLRERDLINHPVQDF